MAGLLNGLLRSVSRHGLNIFIFHRVLPQPDSMRPGEPDVEGFEALMQCIRRHWRVLPLEEAIERLSHKALPPRAAALTFDDGYADNLSLAAPILERLGLSATVFLASGFLNGGRMWNDTVIEALRRMPGEKLDLRSLGLGRYPLRDVAQRRIAAEAVIGGIKYAPLDERRRVTDHLETLVEGLPDDLMLDEAAIRSASPSVVRFGAHTVDHPILSRLDEGAARRQIVQGKADVEAIIGEEVRLFAYPNGKAGEDYLPRDVDLVRNAGFRAAVATDWGVARTRSDLFQLPRYTPWRSDCLGFSLQMLRHYWQQRGA